MSVTQAPAAGLEGWLCLKKPKWDMRGFLVAVWPEALSMNLWHCEFIHHQQNQKVSRLQYTKKIQDTLNIRAHMEIFSTSQNPLPVRWTWSQLDRRMMMWKDLESKNTPSQAALRWLHTAVADLWHTLPGAVYTGPRFSFYFLKQSMKTHFLGENVFLKNAEQIYTQKNPLKQLRRVSEPLHPNEW